MSYTPTTWQTGDTITANKLNKIETELVALDGDVGDLKSAIDHIETTQIVGMTATGETIYSSNLFDATEYLVQTGKYCYVNAGKIAYGSNAIYNTYIFPVDATIYHLSDVARFTVMLQSDELTAIGDALANVKTVDNTNAGAAYLAISFDVTQFSPSTYSVKKEMATYFVPEEWVVDKTTPLFETASGEMGAGDTLSAGVLSAVKEGVQVIFKATITSFSAVRINFVNPNNNVTNYVEVDGTNLKLMQNSGGPYSYAHSLTIENDISIIFEFVASGKAKVTVYSNGNSFSTTRDWAQMSSTISRPVAVSSGSVFSAAKISANYSACTRNVWYFGDSYISFNDPKRWVYYAEQAGVASNILFSGSSGAPAATAVNALKALLAFGKPKKAVFATGMNNGSDSSSAPVASWVTARDEFLSVCKENNIEPIFATIPTVPSINNEKKNDWIRASGYRFIDFAAAVGANSSGVWYTGMLYTDNVHPTAQGAEALFTQAAVDLPEMFTPN